MFEYKMGTARGEHVRRVVSLVAVAVDDFTDQVIIGQGLRVCDADTRQYSIAKSEGYHVFVNTGCRIVSLELSAPYYNTERVTVDTAELDPLGPIVKVRMKPNRLYGLPFGTTVLLGKAQPGALIRLAHEHDPKPLKLLYDYAAKKDRDVISLFHPQTQDIEGKSFAIRSGEEEKPEHFAVLGKLEDKEGGYRIDTPLKKDYKKVGAAVFPVYTVRADNDGNYFLPVRNLAEGTVSCTVQAVGEKVIEKNITVEERKENTIDLI